MTNHANGPETHGEVAIYLFIPDYLSLALRQVLLSNCICIVQQLWRHTKKEECILRCVMCFEVHFVRF